MLISVEGFNSLKAATSTFASLKSSIWKGIFNLGLNENFREIIEKGLINKVGKGDTLKFWTDIWFGDISLATQFPRLFSVALYKEASIMEMRFWDGSNWQWYIRWRRNLFDWEKSLEVDMLSQISVVSPNLGKEDYVQWKWSSSGVYSIKYCIETFHNKT